MDTGMTAARRAMSRTAPDEACEDARLDHERWEAAERREERLRAAVIAHIEARDAYFAQWARKSGWHDNHPIDDGSAARETWRELRALVGS